MFRVDVENILRQCTNVHGARNRYPNPLTNTKYEHDNFESDEFRMYSFKIKKCPLNRAHDWTICPYVHMGERARRRDPCHMAYKAVSCTDYRVTRGTCPRGDLCEYAHGVFEYWLHPAKYRTRICHAGTKCTRPVCFFAHKPDELRIAIDPTTHIPNWALQHVQRELEAQARMLSRTTNVARINNNSIACEQGLGVTGHLAMPNTPNPLANTAIDERFQELRLEVLESLRMMRISDYYNNQVVQISNKVDTTNEDFDVPNVDWVTDLLLG